MSLRHLAKISLGVLLLSLSSSAVALEPAGSTPKGAVKLTKSKLRQKTGYYCGYVQKRWVPGRVLSATTFYPSDTELSNLNAELKKASGKNRAAIQKQIANIRKAMGSRRLTCSAIAKSGTKTRLTKVLSTQATYWSSFQSIRRISSSSSGTPTIRPQTSDIVFNLSQAIALAKAQTASGSNLLAVNRNGVASDALLSGNAVISDFYSSPNGKIYLVFAAKVPLVDGDNPCLLAEVDSNTGVPTCVDSAIEAISSSFLGLPAGPIQFDDAGNLFYAGTQSRKTVLRRYSNGQVSDLLNDNILLYNFLVMPDGSVIISGLTESTQTSWVRSLSPSGSLRGLVAGEHAGSLLKFADGNAYFGIGGSYPGVRRFLSASRSLDPSFWFGPSSDKSLPPPYFAWESFCSDESGELRRLNRGLCDDYGVSIGYAHTIPGSATYVVAGSQSNAGAILMQYYPAVEKQESAVTYVLAAQAGGKKILLSGLSSTGRNITTLFDLETKVELLVIGASNEIEIYNLTYAQDINRILFNGLRFSDNRYVVGEIDLSE